jgi:dihydrofolate reductase
MARLIYSAICSLDLYVNDTTGGFDWAAPDEEVHAFVNDREREIGAMLLGRRMYDVLKAWEQMGSADDPPPIRDFAGIWRAAEKIVYSTTLAEPVTARTRIEHSFDPGAVRAMVDASARDASVGGPTLAGAALRAGIVDRVELFVNPVVVGGGTRAFPDGVRFELRLEQSKQFANGVVYLRYSLP